MSEFNQMFNHLLELGQEQSELEELEEWRSENLAVVESLKDKLEDAASVKKNEEKLLEKTNLEIATAAAVAATQGASRGPNPLSFFGKQKLPTFGGEVLEYLDFKLQWSREVHLGNVHPGQELSLLKRNIPKEAQDMMLEVNDLEAVWKILDRLYGDKKLISQKLKRKMKSLKPTVTEPHEKIIWLNNQIVYLGHRMKLAGCADVLYTDCDYLTNVYFHLPEYTQHLWDHLDKSSYENEWEAFAKFMERQFDVAMSKRAVMIANKEESTKKAGEKVSEEKKCSWCGKPGHKENKCYSKTQGKERVVQAGAAGVKNQSCPECKRDHFYGKPGYKRASDRLYKCPQYLSKNVNDRAAALEEHKACSRCTSWSHQKKDCPGEDFPGKEFKCQTCSGNHDRSVCGTQSLYVGHARVAGEVIKAGGAKVGCSVMPCQDLQLKGVGERAHSLWDTGCDNVLIRNEFARKCGLKKEKMKYTLSGVEGTAEKDEFIYYLSLVDLSGAEHRMIAYGTDDIMGEVGGVDWSRARKLFPHIPDEVFQKTERKALDLLIGVNYLHLHPSGGEGRNAVKGLRVLNSNFGNGWVLSGKSELVKRNESEKESLDKARVRANRAEIHPHLDLNFWQADGLGVEPPRCYKCAEARKGCKDCVAERIIRSRQDEEELVMLKKGMKVDREAKTCNVTYAFIKDPNLLENNRHRAKAFQLKQEKVQKKQGVYEAFQEEFESYVKRGAIVKLGREDLVNYKGPVSYITYHSVLKESNTSAVRIVSNPSLKNNGISLNECLAKGPDNLNEMHGNLCKFRSYEKGLAFDITKAYNALKTTIVERNLRRILWRPNDQEEFAEYGFDRVQFGDRGAACIMQLGIEEAAEIAVTDNPEADEIKEDAAKLKEDIYVDDGTTGGTEAEVARMKGLKLEDGTFSGTIPKMLAEVGYKVKTMVESGESDEEAVRLLGGAVLGYGWDAGQDKMKVRMRINVSKKYKGMRTKPDLDAKELMELKAKPLTRRILLGLTNAIHDPLGIASPFTVKLKLAMKKVIESATQKRTSLGTSCYTSDTAQDTVNKRTSLGTSCYTSDIAQETVKKGKNGRVDYDEIVSAVMTDEWFSLLEEVINHGDLEFPRGARPKGAEGPATVVGFWDGAFPAYAVAVYLVWKVRDFLDKEENEYSAELLTAKAKVAPLKGLTIPRSECNSLTMCTRLVKKVVKSMREPPEKAIFIGDSRCVISSVKNTTSSLHPFMHNRVGEILENIEEIKKTCEVEPLQHVDGKLNVADLATRGDSKLVEIGPGSLWQKGPEFLRKPRNMWPVTSEFKHEALPKDETKEVPHLLVAGAVVNEKKQSMISVMMSMHNDLDTVTKSVSEIIQAINKKIGRPNMEPAEAAYKARNLVLAEEMYMTQEAEDLGKLSGLMVKKKILESGAELIVTTGRIGEKGMSEMFGVSYLPVLSKDSRAAELYLMKAHCGEGDLNHRGVTDTVARSKAWVWVVGAMKLARKISKKCPKCIQERKNLQKQRMGELPLSSLKPCPPFTNLSLDFAGPFTIKGTVNTRARKKVWLAIYVCRNTKAVEILVVDGYSTAAFLLKHQEFVARYRNPKEIQTDAGSNLKKAKKLLDEKGESLELDWKEISAGSQTKWTVLPPGAQHRNGLPESMVKMAKKAMYRAIPKGETLTQSELVTLMVRISNSMNNRPLGLHKDTQGETLMEPITPNLLLKGSVDQPLEEMWEENENFPARLKFIEAVHQRWWDLWGEQVLHTLVPARRWTKAEKNVKVGDICRMMYKGKIRDLYRLVKVLETHPEEDGLVRTVTVGYKRRDARNNKSNKLITEKAHVQRLIIIQPTEEPKEENIEEIDTETMEENKEKNFEDRKNLEDVNN